MNKIVKIEMFSLRSCPEKTCPKCGGSGMVVLSGDVLDSCSYCEGTGKVPY